jgi:Sec-independent protein secretion pathway component TatC
VIWIPLYLMYEVGIWGARIFGTRREEKAGAGVQASAA